MITNAASLNAMSMMARLRMLARESGLDDVALAYGLRAQAIDACYANSTDAQTVAMIADAAWARIRSVPSAEVNGTLIQGVGWEQLAPSIAAGLEPR